VVTAVGVLLRLEQTAELLYILVVLTSVVEQFGQALVVLDGKIVRPHPICSCTATGRIGSRYDRIKKRHRFDYVLSLG